MCALYLLAIIAGNLLLDNESAPSSSNTSADKDQCAVVDSAQIVVWMNMDSLAAPKSKGSSQLLISLWFNALDQVSPGVFNERVFRYVKWAKEAGITVSSSDDSFFSNPVIKDYCKAYIKAVVNRKNSFSGVRQFFWFTFESDVIEIILVFLVWLKIWIAEIAAYIKSLDKRHLVTVGVEAWIQLTS
ncbi:unnamed protein product [Dovyalis caffra]|uniref:Uncharacterized protein n=1 Tax=Dovyalis caffra TaxID=77055 RepID=A0AAV1SNL6_9ROSI|nr:unnamed protein product [Dovyalis caffra]